MKIDITDFVNTECPMDYSASVAEIGNNAGRDTWNAALERASEEPRLLDTVEKTDAMRAFALSSGGWNQQEINQFTDIEVNALFIQWISGDMRECGLDKGATWDEIEALQSEGQAPGNLFKGIDGRIYFTLDN